MKIIINGIKSKVIVGCYEYEKQNEQEIVVDLICELYPFNWLENDSLENTVDYDNLVDFIKNILHSKQYNLLEGLSQFIASEVLSHYSLVKTVQIWLSKVALCGAKAELIRIFHQEQRKHKVALALGSNSSNLPQQQLVTAIEMLANYMDDIAVGGFYKTSPIGEVLTNDFMNTAIVGTTKLNPDKLLSKIKKIEKLMGKEELIINGPRVIDIDIIFFDNLVYFNNFLQIPHREMHNRDFVLFPLADVATSWVHPRFNKTVLELKNVLLSQHASNIIERINYYK